MGGLFFVGRGASELERGVERGLSSEELEHPFRVFGAFLGAGLWRLFHRPAKGDLLPSYSFRGAQVRMESDPFSIWGRPQESNPKRRQRRRRSDIRRRYRISYFFLDASHPISSLVEACTSFCVFSSASSPELPSSQDDKAVLSLNKIGCILEK